jgi:uncharacterized protein Usg
MDRGRVFTPQKGKVSMADKHFIAQLKGYCLTTAEILYHMPDHPALLQSFIWQEYDLAPRFPKLLGFLEFWNGNLDGKVNRVRVCNKRLIDPAEFRFLDGRLLLQ